MPLFKRVIQSLVLLLAAIVMLVSLLLCPFLPSPVRYRTQNPPISYNEVSEPRMHAVLTEGDGVSRIPNVKPNQLDLCDKWAVVAPTDSELVSEAVRRQARLHDWCLVIVFKEKPSHNYDPEWYVGRGNKAVIYLTRKDVETLGELATMRSVPWNGIGRKMVGYLYAIAHGATVIWDFDDNNMLKFWIPGAAPPGAPSIETAIPATERIKVQEVQGHAWPTYNPYPVLGAPALPSWPRGLPLDDALREECSKGELKESEEQSGSIAVLQSLSDHQPDADIIYQGTMPFPFFFKRTTETRPLLVPRNTFSPYNSKASLHLQSGLWAMYLPLLEDEELSDIWRGYIAQRLFWDVGLRVGFMARPSVVQDHNIHITPTLSQLALKASNQTKQLISFLGSWRGKGETLTKRIEELWNALYDHKFINKHEVETISLWLQGLKNIEYNFPALKDVSISHSEYPTNTPWNIPSFPNKDTKRYTTRRNKLEYSDEVCHTSKPNFTFWNSDTHYGSRIDLSSFLGSIGNNVYEAVGIRQNKHPEVWSMPGVHLYNRVSGVIKKVFPDFTGMNTRLDEEMTKENFEFYKTDPQFRSVDAIYCLFPASLCEMWMPFNKTLMIIPAHRYSMGRCAKEDFDRLNEHLRMLDSIEHPKHIMAASSKYDMEYLRHYTGIRDVLPLYAHSSAYIGDITYAPTRDEILLFLCPRNHDYFYDKRYVTEFKKFKIVEHGTLYHDFKFSNFVKHRAVVYHPYAVMSYKMTELYRLGIPIFFPSMKYLQTIKPLGPDRPVLSQYYCSHVKGPLKDSEMIAHENSIHPYSPNLLASIDMESEYYWLQLADFSQWPHCTYYDDFKDLERKLAEANFEEIHRGMMIENERRDKEFLNNWCKVFNQLEKGRIVPQDYDKAIKELYGVSKLQVH